MSVPGGASAASARRCRARSTPSGGLRPTDLVGAFFVAGIAFLCAGALAGVVELTDPWRWGRWLALHLAFVGGISQLVLGASQFFLGAFLATEPPPRGLVRGQLVAWNAGSVLVALGVPLGSAELLVAGGLSLGASLACYAAALAGMWRRSLRPSHLAAVWYGGGAACLALGLPLGIALALGAVWPHGDLLAAHVALNVGGWFGAAIVGTLHTFYPSLTRTELPRPALELLALPLWLAGIVALAAGYAWAWEPLATAGWAALLAAALALAVNSAGCLRAAPRPLSLAARLLGVAQLFMLAGLALALTVAVGEGPAQVVGGESRAALAVLLLAGWVGITVLGSLVHLLAVVVRVRDLRRPLPAPRPRADLALTWGLAVGVAAVALARSGGAEWLLAPGVVLLAAGYALLWARVLALAGAVLTRVRPRV